MGNFRISTEYYGRPNFSYVFIDHWSVLEDIGANEKPKMSLVPYLRDHGNNLTHNFAVVAYRDVYKVSGNAVVRKLFTVLGRLQLLETLDVAIRNTAGVENVRCVE